MIVSPCAACLIDDLHHRLEQHLQGMQINQFVSNELENFNYMNITRKRMLREALEIDYLTSVKPFDIATRRNHETLGPLQVLL